jgi:hypothetical protein
MFGEGGWCPTCGVPQRSQTGSLVLLRSGFKQISGAWIPNWQFDAICLERAFAEAVSAQFKVEMLDVAWRGTPPGEARQIVVPSVGDRWFDPDELAARAIARHGTSGSACRSAARGSGWGSDFQSCRRCKSNRSWAT